MDDFENYEETKPKITHFSGTKEEVTAKVEKFKKEHTVIDTKQYTETIAFVFYVEGDKNI